MYYERLGAIQAEGVSVRDQFMTTMAYVMCRWFGETEVEKVKASGKHIVEVVTMRIQLRIAGFSAGVAIL